MITIIFSDTHLTYRFEKKKFDYLKRIIAASDRVIINGDFWDGYFADFGHFIKSKWSKLFPLLKSKETIYIYGNHDRRDWCDKRASLFSSAQVDFFDLNVGKNILHIEHGNKIAPAPDDRYPWIASRKIRRIVSILILMTGKLLSTSFGRKYLGRTYHKKIKQWWIRRKDKNNQVFLICGHSHVTDFDNITHYINTGFIRHGYGHYLKIVGGKLYLMNERY